MGDVKGFIVTAPLLMALAVAILSDPPNLVRLPRPEPGWHQQVTAAQAGKSTSIVVLSQPIGDDEVDRLRGASRLVSLELGRSELTARGAVVLQSLPNLRTVVLKGNVNDELLQVLCEIPTLRYLRLAETTITDQGLNALEQRPQLLQLRLQSSRVTDDGMQSISRLSRLRFLHLIDVPITDRGLDRLSSLTNLESLYIDNARLTDQGISRLLKALPELHLHIDQLHHDGDPRGADHVH